MDYVRNSRLKKLRMRVEVDNQFVSGGKKLKVRGKELDELPPELFVLTELEVLDLSPERESCIYYHLTEIPDAISKLTNLKVLMLDTNNIADLPPSISLLDNLQKLSLSNNCLTSLPPTFGRMKSLQSLHMANNEFGTFPTSICELTNLTFLDICDNKINGLPENIGDLTNLESLLLYMNKLTSLPEGICKLVELRSLWIGDNLITRLPRNFPNLVNLDWGSRYMSSCVIDGNPLKQPPMYICKGGVTAIENYFKISENAAVAQKQQPAENIKPENE